MAEKHVNKYSKSLVISKMQIKMTLKFQIIPIRMAIIKISGDSLMLERMWKKRDTPPLPVRLHTGTTTLEINLKVLQKIENRSI